MPGFLSLFFFFLSSEISSSDSKIELIELVEILSKLDYLFMMDFMRVIYFLGFFND